MKVKNINGTGNNTCGCGSWLSHWMNFSQKDLPSYCAVETCAQKPELGAHVQKDNSTNNNWYIIPLCKAHNKSMGSLSISDSVELVSANVNDTCG